MYYTDNIQRTPKSLVADVHGTWGNNADPRRELDQRCWSFILSRYESFDFTEIETWCDDMLGNDNWYRMFNKFWFTSESEYVMFRLVWSGVENGQ
jgi:hypothetical protein